MIDLRAIYQHMKRIILSLAVMTASVMTFAQEAPTVKKKKDWSKVSLGARPNDHFMMQFGRLGWAGAEDSMNTRGWSKSFNMYFMIDWPFKTDYRWSVAAGLGLGTDNMFFNNRSLGITASTQQLQFTNLDSANHFKKYKLATSYLEIPIELRFSSNPEDPSKSWKFAIGAKAGLMIDAHTKGKTLVTKTGASIAGGDYVEKIRQKKYFNGQRLALTGRVGYGNFSLWASYQITTLIKDGRGADVRPVSIGIALSGL